MPSIRLLGPGDVPELVDLLNSNRDFLAPWEPVRDSAFFTAAGQLSGVEDSLRRHAEGTAYPHVIVDDAGVIVGRITIENVVRRAFQSCNVGYWISEHANGLGIASVAVGQVKELAFRRLGLHRIEAGTLTHNLRSQRVLEKNGFVRFGLAPAYLNIAGRWQDHLLFQSLATPAST